MSIFTSSNSDHYLTCFGLYPLILNTSGSSSVECSNSTLSELTTSPVPFADEAFRNKVVERIVKPTVAGIQARNMNYCGFIFIGLMNVNGDPYVIEYNCRMGDPETEVVFPRIENDIVEVFTAVAKKELHTIQLKEDKRIAVTLMMVSGGYPGNYEKGFEITGLDKIKDSTVYHAGTATSDKKIVSSGGRVLAITSLDTDLQQALNKSYAAAKTIHFDYEYYRKDIGQDLIRLAVS